ncbi:DUF4132 domain-containing protein [Nonomuraea indica]|uniref:DUF4132 domain-containing protein n=1 Tax=Nonomuraea indica TaxID=1581193 RepID=UPI000C7DD282|nr:DUF4132 domain-containing protein [Nonomuraea indica]
MHLSPLAERLLRLLDGSAPDPTHWPVRSQLTTAMGGRPGDGPVVDQTWGNMVAPARELTGRLLRDDRLSFAALVTAGLADMDAEVRARFAEALGPIAVAEVDVVLGWDVESRALFAEAARGPVFAEPRLTGLGEWLGGLPGYPAFARAALEQAEARVAAIQVGEIPYRADKAFDPGETRALGRAVRLALHRDEPWLPALLDGLLRGVAVAPTDARTLPSQALLFEIARAVEDHPTPEAISSLRAVRRCTRHAGVPKQLDRMFKRIEPALAERLEVAFRLPDGRVRQAFGDHTAVISIEGGGELSWWHGDKKLRSVPAAVRREHPEAVKRLREQVKLVQQQQVTLARALEASYTAEKAPPYRQLEGHPIAERLIWEFEVSPGVWRAELGLGVPDVPVRQWHPARASVEEVRAWREVVQSKELRQPYKQAFREVYLLTPAEEETRDHSRRFADHVVDYRRLRALFKARGWKSNYLGPWDGGFDGDDARRLLAGGQWRATLTHGLYDEGFALTGNVLFHRLVEGRWHLEPLAEVPTLVFSEAMRDVDLFVGVSSITADPRWAEDGPEALRTYWRSGSFAALAPSAEIRREVLSRLLPRLAISDRCTLTDRFLVVRGDLRTYKIHLGSANILMEPNDAYLCIVAGRDSQAGLFLPFEEDGRLALILSKAFLLADDTAITDPSITRQLRS